MVVVVALEVSLINGAGDSEVVALALLVTDEVRVPVAL